MDTVRVPGRWCAGYLVYWSGMQNDIGSKRIRTTHVGSLPRPESLLALLRAKTDGLHFDAAALDAELTNAIHAVVARQVDMNIDFVSDGEFSKPSYATYITERLTGFGGEFAGHAAQDLRDYRDFARHLVQIGGVVPTAGGACCQGPVHPKDTTSLETDLENLQAAIDATQPV